MYTDLSPAEFLAAGPRIVTFRDDGVFGSEAFAAGLTIRDEDSVGVGQGFMTVAAGRWSADEGLRHGHSNSRWN